MSLTSLALTSGSHHLRLSNHHNNNFLDGHQYSQQQQQRDFYYTKTRRSVRNNNNNSNSNSNSSKPAAAAVTQIENDATESPPPPRARGVRHTVSGSSDASDESMDLMELYRDQPPRRRGRRERTQPVQSGSTNHSAAPGPSIRAGGGNQEKATTSTKKLPTPYNHSSKTNYRAKNHPSTMECHNIDKVSSFAALSTNSAAVCRLQPCSPPAGMQLSASGNSGIDHVTSALIMDDFSECSESSNGDDDDDDDDVDHDRNHGDWPQENKEPKHPTTACQMMIMTTTLIHRHVVAADETEAYDEFGGDNDDDDVDEDGKSHVHHDQQQQQRHQHMASPKNGISLSAPSTTPVPSCSTSLSLKPPSQCHHHQQQRRQPNTVIVTKEGARRNDKQLFFFL